MANERTHWAATGFQITHGTATPVRFQSIVPKDKRAKEVFWTSVLISRLGELSSLSPTVISCQDDSNGKHDVIVNLDNGESIGVQVTELTYELERARRAQSEKFISEVLACLRSRGLSSERSMLVSCFVPFVPGGRYKLSRPENLANACADFLQRAPDESLVELDRMSVLFQWVDNGELYVPTVSGIGVACDLGELPRTLEMYSDAISCIRDKKSESISPWLLIWSQSFWRDKHWLGKMTIEQMQKSFESSSFAKVFFVESMDRLEFFEANVAVHAIKS